MPTSDQPAGVGSDSAPPRWLPDQKQESSVRHLQALYSVVAGTALYEAVSSLVAPDGPFDLGRLPLFVAFLVTVVPFYHGGMRHMDDAYLDEATEPPRNGALLADFAFLFIEGCLLVALANLVGNPDRYPRTLLALLAFDAAWAVSTHVGFAPPGTRLATARGLFTRGARTLRTTLTWAAINVVASALLVAFLVAKRATGELDGVLTAGLFVMVLSLVRTAVDYRLCWSFYFPPVVRRLAQPAAPAVGWREAADGD